MAMILSLENVVQDYPRGQEAKNLYCKSFLKEPANLNLLDEATSALDNESEQHIQKSLTPCLVNQNNNHDRPSFINDQNADEILVIDGQTIKKRGTHEEPIASGGL